MNSSLITRYIVGWVINFAINIYLFQHPLHLLEIRPPLKGVLGRMSVLIIEVLKHIGQDQNIYVRCAYLKISLSKFHRQYLFHDYIYLISMNSDNFKVRKYNNRTLMTSLENKLFLYQPKLQYIKMLTI